MSDKTMVHLEGNRYSNNQFFMSQRCHGPLKEQLAMIAQYCIQVAMDTGESPYIVIGALMKLAEDQVGHESIFLDAKIIQEILGGGTNGQKN